MKMIKNKLIATSLLMGTILSMGSVVHAECITNPDPKIAGDSYENEPFSDWCGFAAEDGFVTYDREKFTKSYIYIHNKCDLELDVGVKSTSDSEYRTWGGHWADIPARCERGIRNSVKEDGYNWCYLVICAGNEGLAGTASGCWSPDASGDYPAVYGHDC